MSEEVKEILSSIWNNVKPLEGRKIDVEKYPKLSHEIPDKSLEISEVFLPDKIEEIWKRFDPHTKNHCISPFIEIYGNVVICIGNAEDNLGKIYYFDFDFGCFQFEESLSQFIGSLVE